MSAPGTPSRSGEAAAAAVAAGDELARVVDPPRALHGAGSATAEAVRRAGTGAGAAAVPLGERMGAGVVSTACFGVLVVASRLTPAAAGHGTHEQLGLPPCGWLHATGFPCPTCGMTTAFAHAAGGDLLAAMATQPMGALLAVGTAAGFWISLHVAIFGSRLGRVCGRLMRPRWLWAAGAAWGGSWAYMIATWQGG